MIKDLKGLRGEKNYLHGEILREADSREENHENITQSSVMYSYFRGCATITFRPIFSINILFLL